MHQVQHNDGQIYYFEVFSCELSLGVKSSRSSVITNSRSGDTHTGQGRSLFSASASIFIISICINPILQLRKMAIVAFGRSCNPYQKILLLAGRGCVVTPEVSHLYPQPRQASGHRKNIRTPRRTWLQNTYVRMCVRTYACTPNCHYRYIPGVVFTAYMSALCF